jgi:hypothetical protein
MSKTRICLNCAYHALTVPDSGSVTTPQFAPCCLKGLNPSIEHAPPDQFVREQGAFEPDAMAAFCDSYVWAPPISSKFKAYVRKKLEKEPRYSTTEIPEKFIRFWEKGHNCRIKIERGMNLRYWEYGYVSMSTGWRPALLLVKSVRARGSSVLLREDDIIVGVRDWNHKAYKTYRDES